MLTFLASREAGQLGAKDREGKGGTGENLGGTLKYSTSTACR